jgi:AcrR family transcriptional regulator
LRGAAREAAILAATLELLSEVGFERLTCDAVAARARASKATIYRKWPDKAALVADAVRRHTEQDAPPAPDTGDLRQDLLRAVADTAEGLVDGSGPSVVTLLGAARSDSAVRSLLADQVRRRTTTVGQALYAQARARGEQVRAEAAGLVIELAFGQLLTQTLLDGYPPSVDAHERLVDEVLLPVLRPGS